MGPRITNAAAKSGGVKAGAWGVVILALTTAGCGVSEKSPTLNYGSRASAGRQHMLIAADNKAQHNFAERTADEDFDLLEEELVERKIEVADPLEPVNRIMYFVNDTLYFWVLKPVTQIYADVAPKPARIGIRNFFHNLTTPVRLVSCLLQGKGHAAGNELHRFVVNTTLGVLGFGDPARDKFGFEPAEEDLGQTLAVYGLGNGFYIVWPLLGPSTVRDSLGKLGDLFLNPVFYVEPTEASIGISAVKGTNQASFHIGEYESFKAEALEPYVAMREAYIQYRNKKIRE